MRKICFFSLVLFFLLLISTASWGSDLVLDWPLNGQVELPFGSYERDGVEHFHYGIDISGSAEDEVLSPIDGTVAYLGKPPAAGGELCLSLVFDNYRLTLFPLENSLVSQGDEVKRGMNLGFLASQGDASSPSTHLHLGLRDGQGHYLDPLTFLKPLSLTEEAGGGSRATEPSLVPEETFSLKESATQLDSGDTLGKSVDQVSAEKINLQKVGSRYASCLSEVNSESLTTYRTEKERREFLSSLARLQAVVTSLSRFHFEEGSFMRAFSTRRAGLTRAKRSSEPSFSWRVGSDSSTVSKLTASSLTQKIFRLLYWFVSLSLPLFLFFGLKRKRAFLKFA